MKTLLSLIAVACLATVATAGEVATAVTPEPQASVVASPCCGTVQMSTPASVQRMAPTVEHIQVPARIITERRLEMDSVSVQSQAPPATVSYTPAPTYTPVYTPQCTTCVPATVASYPAVESKRPRLLERCQLFSRIRNKPRSYGLAAY